MTCLGDGVCTNPRCPTHGIEWTFDGAPRSAEIPEAAVEKALDVLMDDGHNGIDCRPDRNFEVSVRAALVAARPYLMPTREQIAEAIGRHGYDPNNQDPAQDATRCRCGDLVDEWDEHWADAVLALLNGPE